MSAAETRTELPFLMPVLLAGLVLALAGLVAAFVVSFNLADHQNRLSTLSERQASAVGQIVVLADLHDNSSLLDDALARYRVLIAEETALMPVGPANSRQQGNEAVVAAELERLARNPANASAFRHLASGIAQREAGEVAASRRELARLHARTVGLAVALAVVALLCALSAAWLLARRSRSLEALVEARTARLEEVDRSRRLFFAKASHELRTPITAMRGEAELALLDPTATVASLHQSLSHIHANANFLGHRIEELLGLASADDGKLHLTRNSLELAELIADVLSEAEAFARSVEVAIVQCGPDRPARLHGDARWLRQAMLTVIDNALKFSPMGDQLAIELAIAGDMAKIAVSDNGPGVMQDDLPRIFDAYYQSEPGRQRGGNGLGLALARWVVEQHGGAIAAANRPEGGCTVTILLPLEEAA